MSENHHGYISMVKTEKNQTSNEFKCRENLNDDSTRKTPLAWVLGKDGKLEASK